MLKKYLLCFFLIATSSNSVCSEKKSIFQDAYQAGKRGALFAALTSTPCLFMSNSSWMETLATPFVASAVGGVGSFSMEAFHQHFSPVASKTLNFLQKNSYFNSLITKVSSFISDTKDIADVRKFNAGILESEFRYGLGTGFGAAMGLVICALCYTKTGLFDRN